VRAGPVLSIVAMLTLAGCAGAPGSAPSSAAPRSALTSAPPAAIVLRQVPANTACDSIGWPDNIEPFRDVTFRIDPTATEHVFAVSNTGIALVTEWAAGFEGGTTLDPVVRDAEGQVVLEDGDVLNLPAGTMPRLAGYPVCLTPTTLTVMLDAPGG
jgi:hypothetical protein